MHDPLAGMAEANEEVLAELLAHVETENEAVQAMLDKLLGDPDALPDEVEQEEAGCEPPLAEAFQVVVECRDEAQQQAVYERLTGEGYACKLLTL